MKECPACRRCFPDHVNHCPDDGDATTHSIAGEPILDGRYQLERRLGHGGMGVVFQARHIFLKTAHAIKVILPDLVGNDPMLVTRFRQEALAAAAIRHQNIIAVTDFGVARGTMPFLVMEYVKGKSLQELLAAEGALPPGRALEIMGAIGAGVGAAHRQGIVHRDLKPLNIMMQEELSIAEGLKVLDFGLAKIKSGELLGSFVQAKTSGLMGSPFYMAPEQWGDEEPDARADIYSLGVILFQMLGGDVPFRGTGIPSIMKKHLTADVPSFASMGVTVPAEIERVVRHALAKEAEERPASVEDFVQELRAAVAAVTAALKSTSLGPMHLSSSPSASPSVPPVSPRSSGPLYTPAEMTELRVRTNPPQARVFVNNVSVGASDSKGELVVTDMMPGLHFVRVLHDGYADWEQQIECRGGECRVEAQLQSRSQASLPSLGDPLAGTISSGTLNEIAPHASIVSYGARANEQEMLESAERDRFAREELAREEAARLQAQAATRQRAEEERQREAAEARRQAEAEETARAEADAEAAAARERAAAEARVEEQARQQQAALEAERKAAEEAERKAAEEAARREELARREEQERKDEFQRREEQSRREREQRDEAIAAAAVAAERAARQRADAEAARERADAEQAAESADAVSRYSTTPLNAGKAEVTQFQRQAVTTNPDAGVSLTGSQHQSNWQNEQASLRNQPHLPASLAGRQRKSALPFILSGVLAVVLIGGGIGAYLLWLRPQPVAQTQNPPPRQGGPTETPPRSGQTEIKPDLVEIPGGTFQMGRNAGNNILEGPAHAVTVPSFAMDRTEVTNAEYELFVRETKHRAPSDWVDNKPVAGQERWPVTNVSFDDAVAFAEWRTKRDGVVYRLPTEEEWEYAARNGEQNNLYPWGNNWATNRAVIEAQSPQPVGSLSEGKDRWGVVDLIGNAWEWTSSKASLYPGNDKGVIPPQQQNMMVYRGGSFATEMSKTPATGTVRNWQKPSTTHSTLGFRLVRSGS